MTVDNFNNLIAAYTAKRPFRPFTVELLGGEQVEVDHPGAIIYRDGVAVHIKPGGIPVWFDHQAVLTVVGDIAGQPD